MDQMALDLHQWSRLLDQWMCGMVVRDTNNGGVGGSNNAPESVWVVFCIRHWVPSSPRVSVECSHFGCLGNDLESLDLFESTRYNTCLVCLEVTCNE